MAENSGGIESDQMQARLKRLVAEWAQAKVTLRQIVGLSDEELYAIASQGYNMFLQGKTEDARIIFEGLLAIDPKNAYYYRALGAIYWRQKKHDKAIRQFTYAIKVAPLEISSHINRAEVYVATKQFDLARQDLDFALKNGRSYDGALLRKARAILQMI